MQNEILFERGSFYHKDEATPFAGSLRDAIEYIANPANAALYEAIKKAVEGKVKK